MKERLKLVLMGLATLLGLALFAPAVAQAGPIYLVGQQAGCVNSISWGANNGAVLWQMHDNPSAYGYAGKGQCIGMGTNRSLSDPMSGRPNAFFIPYGMCAEWWTDANPDVKHVPAHHVVDTRNNRLFEGTWTFVYPGDSWDLRWMTYVQQWDY